jgi:hypothetical protein
MIVVLILKREEYPGNFFSVEILLTQIRDNNI